MTYLPAVICLFFLLLLSTCSALAQRNDTPSAHRINFAAIPNAVPRPLPHSKDGNPPTYVVFGKRYYVLHSAKGFHERGIASWYGRKFYNHRTSSGELYNMYAMTAAMRSLPIPTFVKVTDLENHRHVIVKVNDRGPFKDNRIIDLSVVAAAKLHMLEKGTALVDVRAINPVTWDKKHHDHPPPLPLSGYPALFLQTGAFTHKATAERQLHRLQQIVTIQHYPVRLTTALVHGQTVYEVQIGPLANVNVSDAVVARLEHAGLGVPATVIE